jgi:aminoglycoside 3-N-acetyltransferase
MIILKFIYYFLPSFIKSYFKGRKVNIPKSKCGITLTKSEAEKIFDGLKFSGDIFVHTSLSDIGKVEGGYKVLVQRLNKSIVDNGYTLLFPAIPMKGSSEDYIKQITTFDVITAPISTGVINQYYSFLPNAERSLSPTHSVIAIGPKSIYYTFDHHISDTPFKENSPYYKLLINKGKVMMLGAKLKHLTLIHVVEDLLGNDYPVRIHTRRSFEINIINKYGENFKSNYRTHSKYRGVFRDLKDVCNSLRALPSTQIIPMGEGELILMDAIDIIVCLFEKLRTGDSPYGRRRISKQTMLKIDYWIDFFNKIKTNEL